MPRREPSTEKASATGSKKSTEPSSTSTPIVDNAEPRYCICQKREEELNDPNEENPDFMIECDGCGGWFHGRCISLADRIADDIEKYFCTECSIQHGPSIFKQRRNQHRRDYSDANAVQKPTQSGTQDFINKLKRKIFPSCDPVVTRLKGSQLTADYLAQTGFTRPILISNRDGLELSVPSKTITLAEIGDLVGHDHIVDIIDCEKQVTYKMSLNDYIDYFESFDRTKIYNVLSLEISNTRLGESVITPKIVRDLSWATVGVWPKKKDEKVEGDIDATDTTNTTKKKATWPPKKKRRTISSTDTEQSEDEEYAALNADHFENYERPEVAKYCLISPQSSYTDFHIDFGGSSVWYSVVRGEKIFYLIEPTDENLQKYADWSRSPNESEIFLGDCVSTCYKMHLREENTVLIPAGWIHAVYTVTDSLVFGGNFLQSMGVDMQLRIYNFERLAQVPHKFKFPLLETFHWFAAKAFYEELKICNETGSATINPITLHASESILSHMSQWLNTDKRWKRNDIRHLTSPSRETFVLYQIKNRRIIPKGINCEKLLRDLARELDLAKSRCGSSLISLRATASIVPSPIKIILPVESKQGLVHFNENKMKVKCRRLSSEAGGMVGGSGLSIAKSTESPSGGVKLTIKTTMSGGRKASANVQSTSSTESPSTTSKKKAGRPASSAKSRKSSHLAKIPSSPDESPKISYTLDLEAKRQRFIQASNFQAFVDENDNDDSSHDATTASSIDDPPLIDNADSHDEEIPANIADGGLASFLKDSTADSDDYYPNKESETKRIRHSSEQKPPKKSKSTAVSSSSSEKPTKLTKKMKTEAKKSSAEATNSTPIVNRKKPPATPISKSSPSTSSTPKKRLSGASPKKFTSKDRMGKILKIANSIKSRGGILT